MINVKKEAHKILNGVRFYNHHIRNAVVAFGRMFASMQIERVNPNDITKNQVLDIPLAYAPKEKALVRVEQDPELFNQVHTVLPTMSFEITGISYDPARKLNRMQRITNKTSITNTSLICDLLSGSQVITSAGAFGGVVVGTNVTGMGIPPNTTVLSVESASSITLTNPVTADGTGVVLAFFVNTIKEVFTPVPYNIDISLYILTKSQEDNLQIVEQILPVFTPEYTVSIDAMPDLMLQENLPIILNSVSMDDEYEGDFQTRRFVTTTMQFTLKLNLFGGVGTPKIITKAITKYSAVADLNNTTNVGHEILTSTGTVPGAPIIDVWTKDF